ncbi:MAG: DUF6498-containing protein [Candidatus Saccharimonas sp.]
MKVRLIQYAIYTVLPFIGIVFLGWDWRGVLILYWLENITVGVGTIINIFSAPNESADLKTPDSEPSVKINDKSLALKGAAAKLFYAGFFMIHYGMFTFVHGIFVALIVSGVIWGGELGWPDIRMAFVAWILGSLLQLAWLIQERRNPAISRPTAAQSFTQPYGRIIALHLAIIFGVILIVALKLPSAAALLLIAIHTTMDVVSYVRWRKKQATKSML